MRLIVICILAITCVPATPATAQHCVIIACHDECWRIPGGRRCHRHCQRRCWHPAPRYVQPQYVQPPAGERRQREADADERVDGATYLEPVELQNPKMRIDELFAIERAINGLPSDQRSPDTFGHIFE